MAPKASILQCLKGRLSRKMFFSQARLCVRAAIHRVSYVSVCPAPGEIKEEPSLKVSFYRLFSA